MEDGKGGNTKTIEQNMPDVILQFFFIRTFVRFAAVAEEKK